MKRLLTLALTLCLLCGLIPLAHAENAEPLRVLDGWWAAEEYQKLYPDRAIETIEITWDQNGHGNEAEIIRSGDWDAACIQTTDYSLAELDALGLTLDLGTVESCQSLAETLYPSIRAGCSTGDKLVALPAGFLGTRSYSYNLLGIDARGNEDAERMKLLQQLGFTQDDAPTTFAEVCELGLRYMALDRKTRTGTMFLFSDSAPQGFSLLYNMLLSYQTEATDANGDIDFDTPAFRAALANADPLLAAFAADPKRTYAKDGSASLVLSEEIGVRTNGAFPHVTDTDAIPAFMTVVIVNPNSKHLSEAIDFALTGATKCGDSELPLLLYQNADYDALLAASYDQTIAAQIEENEDQSVIDELEARKAAGDELYFVPRKMIERYRQEIAPKLIFPRWHSFPMDDAIKDYLSGKLDADAFIAALNQSAATYK